MKYLSLGFLTLLLLARSAMALSVNLAWDYTNSTDAPATGFVMERCTGVNCTVYSTLSSTIPLTTLTYSDGTVRYTTTYSYRVIAINSQGGKSAPSNVVTFQTPEAEMTAPTGLSGTVVK
jgi:hypothetical protein